MRPTTANRPYPRTTSTEMGGIAMGQTQKVTPTPPPHPTSIWVVDSAGGFI